MGSWSSRTASYFDSSARIVLENSSSVELSSPPLRVMAMVDSLHQGHTQLLASWPNQSQLMLWGSSKIKSSAAATVRADDLKYHLQWSSGAVSSDGESVKIISAIAADFQATREVGVVVQGSDGQIYAVNHSASGTTSSFAAIEIDTSYSQGQGGGSSTGVVNTILKEPLTPQLSVVPGVWQSGASPASSLNTAALTFVNEEGDLVLLSRTSEATVWPPRYAASRLTNVQTANASRAVVPLSISLADVNQDCAAELIYAVRDQQQRTYTIYAYTGDSSSPLLLLEVSEASGEVYGSPTLLDVNGDGLPELLLPVQFEGSDCGANFSTSAAGAVDGTSETCTPFHDIRIFNPLSRRGSGTATATASTSCSSSASADDYLQYNISQSNLANLSLSKCGLSVTAEVAASGNVVPFYFPSYSSTPLELRDGDYNRDGFMDIVVPSSYGPMILTSCGSGSSNDPFLCTPLDAHKAAALTALGGSASLKTHAEALSYQTATPFFASMGLLGRLDVVLTHLLSPAFIFKSNSALTPEQWALLTIQVYENGNLPYQSCYLLASAVSGRVNDGLAYGAAVVGATHHMNWQDVEMKTHYTTATQLRRTQGHALSGPQVMVGLGETFSYVQGYSVGVYAAFAALGAAGSASSTGASTSTALVLYRQQWPSYLVPNSQVFAELSPFDSPGHWRLELYLPTSTYRRFLIVSLVIILILVGVPMVVLRWFEIKRDYEELHLS